MPNQRASVNQQVQAAIETIRGTGVPATKLLTAFTWVLGGKPSTKQFRGTGRQYPSASALLTDESVIKISGPGDFAQLSYPFAGLWGLPTTTLHSGAVAAYDQVWTPPIVGSYASGAKSMTVQAGDVVDAEQYAFTIFTGLSYNFTRKQEVTINADAMAQTFTDGVTLTASPTVVQQSPMTGAQMNVYLDTSSAGLGGTLLTDPLKVEYKASDYYAGYWPINRSSASFTDILDKEKKHELGITLQANSAGIAVKSNYLVTGQRAYVRVSGQGPIIENNQTVGVGAATAGTFTLTYKGQTTAGIAYNATAAAVQSALTGLSTIGAGNATVSGTAPNWIVTFKGTLALDTTLLTGSGTGLTGGALSIAAAPVYAAMTHDMACFVTAVEPFDDVDGIYAVKYTLAVAEDANWNTGQAQKMTLTNMLASL